MTCLRFNGVVGILIAGSMIASSTAAVAQTSAPISQSANSWATLTLLAGGAPAAAVCGSAAAVAQTPTGHCVLPAVDTAAAAPPVAQPVAVAPPPPVEAGVSPLVLALGAIALGAAVFLLARGSHHGTFIFPPNSPA